MGPSDLSEHVPPDHFRIACGETTEIIITLCQSNQNMNMDRHYMIDLLFIYFNVQYKYIIHNKAKIDIEVNENYHNQRC